MVHGTDVEKTQKSLHEYRKANAASIQTNNDLAANEASSFQQQQSYEQELARMRRQAARQEYENERRELLEGREDVLSRLAAGQRGDAAAIARQGRKVLLKKSSARRSEEERIRQKQAALRGSDIKKSDKGQLVAKTEEDEEGPGLIKGLKKIKTPEPEQPYDAFGGLVPDKRDYYTLRDHYPSSYLDPIRQDTRMQAGGYDLREYYSRTLLEAFAGLGCFIDEEIPTRDASGTSKAPKLAATEGAAVAASSSAAVKAEY